MLTYQYKAHSYKFRLHLNEDNNTPVLNKLLNNHKFLSLLGTGGNSLLALVIFGLLARSVSPEVFGSWVFFMTTFTLFDMVRSGLLSSALIREASGAEPNHAALVSGSVFRLGVLVSVLFGLLCALAYGVFGSYWTDPGFALLGYGGGILALVSLPHNLSTWLLNAHQTYSRLLFVRVGVQLPLLVGIVWVYSSGGGLVEIFWAYFFANVVASIWVTLRQWSEPKNWLKYSKEIARKVLGFGKYSMGTLLGTSLLRSSDTYLLMSFLGPLPVGLYNVPERLMTLVDIPIRAFITTDFPKLVQREKQGDAQGFNDLLHTAAGLLTWLILPVVLVTLVAAEWLVVLLAGDQYLEAASLLRIFAVYSLLIPLDRYTGIALDALNVPRANFYKVFGMVGVNVLGDVIVLLAGGGAEEVAWVSLATFFSGILLGTWYLSVKGVKYSPLKGLVIGGREIVAKAKRIKS